jgi:histidinol-phosphate aminotransferase
MQGLGLQTLLTHGNFCHVAFGRHAGAIHAALDGRVLYRKDFSEPCLKGYSRFSATTVEKYEPIIEAIRAAVGGVAV